MNRLTPLLLLVLVALAAVLVYRQAERESGTRFHTVEPLLGELSLDDVVQIHAEHVERDEFLTFDRQGPGWRMVEPIDFPAAQERMQLLLSGLDTPAEFVAESEREELARLFTRPRARLELVERREDGALVKHEILLGPLDVDGMRVLASTRGEYFRILRTIDTALLTSVPDFRRREVFGIQPQSVVSFVRERTSEGDLLPELLDFRAERSEGQWHALHPTRVRLDSYVLLLWLQAACRLRAEGFPWDPPTDPDLAHLKPPLERYGLDRPKLSFKVTTTSGGTHRLLFGYPDPPVGWYGMIEGDEHVYAFTNEAITRLAQPWQDLVDDRLLRVFREDVRAFEFDRRTDRLRLEQDATGTWSLARAAWGAEAFTPLGLVDPRRMDEVFGALENTPIERWIPRLEGVLPGLDAEGRPRVAVRAELRGPLEGLTRSFALGAELDPSWLTDEALVGPVLPGPNLAPEDGGPEPPPGPLCAVLRPGDELVGGVDAALVELLERPASTWRSPQLWDLEEIHLSRLELRGADRRRAYERRPQGTWVREGSEGMARELVPLLDNLIFLRAEAYLDPEAAAAVGPELGDEVTVEFRVPSRGATEAVTLGTGPDGAVLVRSGDLLARPEHPELHGQLLELLRAD